jgi:hypothetical protein
MSAETLAVSPATRFATEPQTLVLATILIGPVPAVHGSGGVEQPVSSKAAATKNPNFLIMFEY